MFCGFCRGLGGVLGGISGSVAEVHDARWNFSLYGWSVSSFKDRVGAMLWVTRVWRILSKGF